MLNTNITRRQMVLAMAGAITFVVANGPAEALAKTAKTKKTTSKKAASKTKVKLKRYKIVYKLNGGENPKDQTLKVTQGKTIRVERLRIPTKLGYDFEGWYRDAKLTQPATVVRGKKDKSKRTLYAKWALASYPIEYVFKNGSPLFVLPVSYTMETPTFSLFACTRSGYAFGGWYREASHKNEVRSVKQGSTGALKLYSKWKKASYWSTHLTAKCTRINAICDQAGDQGDSFIFITDMHLPDNCLYSFELVDQVRSRTNVKTAVFGGDAINWSTTKREAKNILSTVRRGLRSSGTTYFIRGNHDVNDENHEGNAETLTNSEYRSLVFGNDDYVTDDRLYYYRDNEEQKIRYFFLDTGHAKAGRLGKTQLSWLEEHMVELDSSWGIVIFQHRYYKIRMNSEAEPVEPELDANGEQLNNKLDKIHGKLSAEIICVISGHCHRDRSSYHEYPVNDTSADADEGVGTSAGTDETSTAAETSEATDTASTGARGFLAFSTTCDAFRQAKTWDDAHPNRTRGTVAEQAFDVITIDRGARKIYATRIGCGSNRTFRY